MSSEQNGWIDWAGGECPVDLGARVQVKCDESGYDGTYFASQCEWKHHEPDHDDFMDDWANITAYRVVPS